MRTRSYVNVNMRIRHRLHLIATFSPLQMTWQASKWKKLIMQLNAPLPLSVSVERLFSCAGQVMNSRRTRMNDKLFESLAFVKANQCLTVDK